MKKTATFLLALLALTQAVAARSATEDFKAYMEAARKEWKVPGMSVVVVKDGKVIFSQGFGTREHGGSEPVDTQTLFGAMSTTKAMTAVAMAVLVEEGKVRWSDDVRDHLPDFRLGDAYVTSQLKIRDLFTHNAGVPNTDILWAGGFDITADEVLRRMRYAQPAYSLRGGFVYQNVMYLVAGKVIERVSGMPWQRFMVERVFGPLGMKNTFATLSASSAYKNRSIAHFMSSGSIRGMSEEMAADEIAPAGSVWSTADDMGIWLNFLLGFSDKKLLQPATMSELFKPQVILPGNFYPTFQVLKPKWTTYGLGWFQHDYRGEKVDFHTGSLTGRTAIAGLIRDRGMGVYVFGNLNREQLRHALMYKAFDTFAFNEPNGRDWSSEFKKLYDGIDATNNAQTASREQRRMKDTRPSLPLASYAGRYSDPFVGTVQVEFTGGKLIVTPGKNTSGELEHRHLDAFIVRWKPEWRGEDLVSFQLSPLDGQVTSLTIAGQTLRKVGN